MHVDRYALKNVGNRNLILPMQSVQFLEAFTAAKKFDIDLFQALESQFLNQIELATGAQLVIVIEAHAAWSAYIV